MNSQLAKLNEFDGEVEKQEARFQAENEKMRTNF